MTKPVDENGGARRLFLKIVFAAAALAATDGRLVFVDPLFAGQAASLTPTGRPAPNLDTTPDTYVLFLDMQEVEELLLCEQVVNQATKHPSNPVLPLGTENQWDGNRASPWGGSLFYDAQEKVFKAWYHGHDVETGANTQRRMAIGYAVSEDGIEWHKPKLGLYDYKGRTDNNMCYRAPDRATGHFNVVKDPKEPDPQRRYQALAEINVATDGSRRVRHVAHYSADGIHWQRSGNGVQEPVNGTDVGFIFIDEADVPQRRFKAYGQHACFTGPDIEHLKFIGKVLSATDGNEHENHFVHTARYRGHFPMLYDFNRFRPYYGHHVPRDAERQKIVLSRIERRRGSLPLEDLEKQYDICVGDVRLATSRDPLAMFQRIQPDSAVVARGERGEWDSGYLVLGGGSLIVHNDQILIFYSAMAEEAASAYPGPSGRTGPVMTGLATLPKDGFTYLRARDGLTRGAMTTKPILVREPGNAKLSVNVSHAVPWHDWVSVEILDAQTLLPIPGYSRQESMGVMTNGTSRIARWQRHATLQGVDVSKIRLRFYFYGKARLYSFTFSPV